MLTIAIPVGDSAISGKVTVTATNPHARPLAPEAGTRSMPIGPVGIYPRLVISLSRFPAIHPIAILSLLKHT